MLRRTRSRGLQVVLAPGRGVPSHQRRLRSRVDTHAGFDHGAPGVLRRGRGFISHGRRAKALFYNPSHTIPLGSAPTTRKGE